MNSLTTTRWCVLIVSAAAALSLPACGKKDQAAVRKDTGNSTANVTPALPSSNTDRSAAFGSPGTAAIAGSTAATGNSTDTAGSASATSAMGGPAAASTAAPLAGDSPAGGRSGVAGRSQGAQPGFGTTGGLGGNSGLGMTGSFPAGGASAPSSGTGLATPR